MNELDLLRKRHSTRRFTDQDLSTALIKDIIRDAQLAPSWENTQPWKLYLATGETTKQIRARHLATAQSHQKSWTEIMPPKNWATMPQANMDAWSNDIRGFLGGQFESEFLDMQGQLFNAPAIIYVTVPKGSSNYSTYDAGAFGYGLLLAASAHGLGAIPAYEFIRFPKEVHEAFTIPEDESLLMGIGIGYPAASKLNEYQSKRRPVDEILQIKD